MTFTDFLAKWQAYMTLNPSQRKGQALLNCLHVISRDDLYKQVDERCNVFYTDESLKEAIVILSELLS